MSEFNAYLDEFGWRADSVYELTRPAWREDPRIPINAIQGYVALDDDRGPDTQLRAAIRRREELLADARARIGTDSSTLQQFNAAYESIRCFTPMVEDHNHWLDQMGDISMRYPALELGRRCVALGSLAVAEDIFHLERADIVEAMKVSIRRDWPRSAKRSSSTSLASSRRRSSAHRRHPAMTPWST
jgi:hypothetical protein